MRLFFLLVILSSNLFAQEKLYYFSGSDWCAPCIKFKKEFIESEEFKSFKSDQSIDFEILDFPQRKKGLTKAYQNHCDSLANLYNQEGSFPKLIGVWEGNVKIYNHKQPSESLLRELKKDFTLKIASLKSTQKLMGSIFNIEIKGGQEELIDKTWLAIKNIERSISSWDSTSYTSLINRNAGVQPVKVPIQLFTTIKACLTLSKATQGAFDITVKPALEIWNWKKGVVPSDNQINNVKQLVGFEKMVLNDSDTTVYLPIVGMGIDFGAFGKGLAADRIIKDWRSIEGLEFGIIDAGGDINILGGPEKIVIPNPNKSNEVLYTLNVQNSAIVTSGDYVRFFEVNGRKYSHIIDPRTCKPVNNGISSVTVVGPKASVADGLATAITVLGEEVGIDLINQLSGFEVVIVKSDGTDYVSKGIKILAD